MRNLQAFIGAAVVAAVAWAANAQSLSTPYSLADSSPRQVGLLTKLVDPSDNLFKQLGIEINGHIEAGYTYNFSNPSTEQNAFRSFDFEHDEFTLNQISLTLARNVDYHKNKFDVGGTIQWIYGGDAGLIHANGIFDWYDGPRNPENQFDPTQFFVDITLPVLNGMRIRAGKFVNLVGYESIDPTADFIGFYSRSFVFGSGYPFTHFGVLGTVDVCKNVTLTAGVTRGDEQGFKDNNDAISFLGSLNWRINDKMAVYLANSTGPEQTNNENDYRTTWDLTFYHQVSKEFKYLVNGYFLYDGAGAADGGSGYLFSVAALASYKLCEEANAKVRVEWFHDNDGLRAPSGTNLYAITLGLDIFPFAKDKTIGRALIVRPEVRYDYSDDKVFDGDNSQFTAALDVIFRF